MSGRRVSDKLAFRIQNLLIVLSAALALLAAVIGFKAIRALNQFDEVHEAAFRAGLIVGKARRLPMPDLRDPQKPNEGDY